MYQQLAILVIYLGITKIQLGNTKMNLGNTKINYQVEKSNVFKTIFKISQQKCEPCYISADTLM